MTIDDDNVQKLVKHLNQNMINPFNLKSDMPNVLVNISTGLHATPEVQKSLLNCVKTGNSKSNSFVKKALSKN